MEEIWKDVVGYEGYYKVSNLGRIRSVDRKIDKGDCVQNRKGKLKKLYENPDGYLTVKFSKNGIDKREFVGRVVAKAFIPMPESDYFLEVNHKDFNRKNNCVDNLEWVTHEENVKYSVKSGRHVSMKGKNNPNYDNHFLAEYYAKHPEEKMKLSRPGKQNGRCVPVTAVFEDGTELTFDYLRECAKYLIENGITKIKYLDGLANKISYCLKHNESYMGISFK